MNLTGPNVAVDGDCDHLFGVISSGAEREFLVDQRLVRRVVGVFQRHLGAEGARRLVESAFAVDGIADHDQIVADQVADLVGGDRAHGVDHRPCFITSATNNFICKHIFLLNQK